MGLGGPCGHDQEILSQLWVQNISMVKNVFTIIAEPGSSSGGLVADERFFAHGERFRGLRVHQTRLQGGDASSDSYCFTR